MQAAERAESQRESRLAEQRRSEEALRAHQAKFSNVSPKRKVKASQVINQMNEAELEFLPDDELQQSYDRYQSKMGALPSPDQEFTTEQITCLSELKRIGATLYVDLGVWGPHHHRLLKKLKLAGLSSLEEN